MSRPSNLGALLYEDEVNFGEVSTSFGTRLNPIGRIDVTGLTQEKLVPGRQMQYQNDDEHHFRGVFGGSFTVQFYLTGYGSTTGGALVETALAGLLGNVIGNNSAAQDGGTVTAVSTATSVVSADSTALAGGMIRVGVINDGRGNGQFCAVDTVVGSTNTLYTALDAAPAVTTDVVGAAELIFPSEGPTAVTVISMRFRILSANQVYDCFGCYPTAISFSDLNAGQLPKVSITFGVARWSTASSVTFPSVLAVQAFSTAPVAAGSFFRQTFGTTTRVKETIRDFSLEIDLGVVPLMGPGAINANQNIIGVTRTRCRASLGFTTDAEVQGTAKFDDKWNLATPTYDHILYTLSAVNGSAVGFYFPKCILTGSRPVQSDVDGLNRIAVKYIAKSSDDTTTDRENANFMLALG